MILLTFMAECCLHLVVPLPLPSFYNQNATIYLFFFDEVQRFSLQNHQSSHLLGKTEGSLHLIK
jgi:hypothetical protein